MRYPASEKLEIIRLVEQSRLPVRQTLEKLAILPARFYRWYDRYQDTRHTRHRSPAHRPVNRMDVAKRRWLFSCDRSLANTHVCLPLPFQPHGTRSPIPLPVFGHTHLSRMIENHSERESIRAFSLHSIHLRFLQVRLNVLSLPIGLTPMTATCRVPPLSRVKLGIGWSRGVARDAEQ